MRQTKRASGAGSHGFGIVNGGGARQRDATGCIERFRYSQNRSDIAGILQTSKNHDAGLWYTHNIAKREHWRTHERDYALRRFRALNCLERGSVQFEYSSTGRNRGDANPAPDKDVQYFQIAATGLLQKFW